MSLVGAAILLAWALLGTVAPWRRPGWRHPGAGLGLEAACLAAVLALALWLGRGPVGPAGRVMLVAAAYWYVTAGGVGLVRLVLRLVPVSEQPGSGGIVVSGDELARGRIIGVLERAILLTLLLWNQFGALGLVLAAKALARFRGLEDRDFAEYFLAGTLASLLHALIVGAGVKLLLH